jgi:5'-nucleotidase
MPSRVSSAALAVLLLACACATAPAPPAVAPAPTSPASGDGFTILQINDTYKIEGLRAGREGGLGRVRALRRELEAEGRPVLVLHAGDFLFPSVMSKYLAGAPMVDALNLLDGSPEFDDRLIVAFGNHEFDRSDPQVLFDRITQSRFRWLTSNVRVRLTP